MKNTHFPSGLNNSEFLFNLKAQSHLPLHLLRACDVCVFRRRQISPQPFARSKLLVTSSCACFAISTRNGVRACAHLSAGRGYNITGHRVGGKIVLFLSQVHRKVDRIRHAFPHPWHRALNCLYNQGSSCS